MRRTHDGGNLAFPENPDLVVSPSASEYLRSKVGDDIITASGTTLLQSDDKAGVVIVMTMARHLVEHPEIPHGPIGVCFTPDE